MSFRSFLLPQLAIALCFGLIGDAQVMPFNTPHDSNSVQIVEATKHVNEGKFTVHDVNVLRGVHTTEATQALYRGFVSSQNVTTKSSIASALVTNGEPDPSYWEYLCAQARTVISSDAPFTNTFEADGKMSAALSPEYHVWMRNHHLTENDGIQNNFENLRRMQIFAETADRRAIPIPRQGLASPNLMI